MGIQIQIAVVQEGVRHAVFRECTTGENVWVLTGDEPMSSRGPTGNNVDHESHFEFMESLNTSTVQTLWT